MVVVVGGGGNGTTSERENQKANICHHFLWSFPNERGSRAILKHARRSDAHGWIRRRDSCWVQTAAETLQARCYRPDARREGGKGGSPLSTEVKHGESDACVPAQAKYEPLTQYNSFSSSFILLCSPFLSSGSLLLLPPSGCRWRSERRGGEGRQKMIMQQAAVLHPDAARHTHTHGYSVPSQELRRQQNTLNMRDHMHTHGHSTCRRHSPPNTATSKQKEEKKTHARQA